MEAFVFPAILAAGGFCAWMIDGGPNKIFAERRRAAEANARAEELRLERAKLDRK